MSITRNVKRNLAVALSTAAIVTGGLAAVPFTAGPALATPQPDPTSVPFEPVPIIILTLKPKPGHAGSHKPKPVHTAGHHSAPQSAIPGLD